MPENNTHARTQLVVRCFTLMIEREMVMKNVLAVLCIALLLCNGVAVAGGLPRGLIAKSRGVELESGKKMLQRALTGASWGKLAELVGKAKQFGAGMAVAGMLTCGTLACTKAEVTNAVQQEQSRVATLGYDRSASLDEVIAGLEQVEGAQVGIIKSVDQQGTLTIETDDGTVYLQLSEGEVLVNNGESPLKVMLSEEVIDAGWIAEGSLAAIIPAAAVAGGLLIFAGVLAVMVLYDNSYGDDNSWLKAATVAGIGAYVAPAMGFGTYHLIVLL